MYQLQLPFNWKKAYPLLVAALSSHGMLILFSSIGAPAFSNTCLSLSTNRAFLLSSTMGTLSSTRTFSKPDWVSTAYLNVRRDSLDVSSLLLNLSETLLELGLQVELLLFVVVVSVLRHGAWYV